MQNALSLEEISSILDAVVSGSSDRAIALIDASDNLSDDGRDRLAAAVRQAGSASDATRALGDALRALGQPRYLANECYRAHFYGSDESVRLARNDLFAHFLARRGGHALDKWPHYFPIYERYLSRYRGTDVRLLEIGVYRGGGLDLLRAYLGPEAQLVGVDIDPVSVEMTSGRHTVLQADQLDSSSLAQIMRDHGPFDVIIDDGGHTMEQQITTAEALIPGMRPGSLYIVEDTHTSYWPEYGGGLSEPGTFIEWAKLRADDVHGYHWSQEIPPTPWTDLISAVHVHDSIVVFDVGRSFAPFSEVVGSWDFLRLTRPQAAVQSELTATTDALAQQLAGAQAALDRSEAERASLLLDSQTQLRAISDSASWRLTEPLRRLRAAFRRV